MTINAIKSTNELEIMRSIYAAAYAPPTQGNSNSQSGASTENLEISAVGNLMNAISQMSSTDQSSIKSFMDDLTSSVQNGTFDASTMADSAPSALTSYAEENGIDLTQLVQTLANGPQNNPGVYGPPPPPMMSSASSTSDTSSTNSLDLSSLENLSSDDKTSLESFLTDLTESVNNGTFDASTMAASAPDSLTNLAEANGVDLTQLIQDMADQIQNNGTASAPPPPPPPMMSGMSGLDFSSLENLSSTDQSSLESFITDLTDEVNNGTFDASTMASSAPESLTSFATANGIDLTQLIQDMADEIENNTSASSTSTASSTTATSFMPPPPPPMMYGANGSGSSSSDDLSSILLSQFLSGNYSDSASAAASA